MNQAQREGYALPCNDSSGPVVLITCEHGGNTIPVAYREMLAGSKSLLDTHRGLDIGALQMAKALAAALQAPLIFATVSRLLVDLNRSIGHPQLHCEAIRKAPAAFREEILKQHYLPYRAHAEQLVGETIKEHGQVLHVSSHSFTPRLNGKVRKTDIGLLYDPARARESAFCKRWQTALKAQAPELTVHRNAPYTGYADGLTTSLRTLFPEEAYLGIELEINHKHLDGTAKHARHIHETVIASMLQAMHAREPKNPAQLTLCRPAPAPGESS